MVEISETSSEPACVTNIPDQNAVIKYAARDFNFTTNQDDSSALQKSDTLEENILLNEYSRPSSSEALQQWAIKYNINHQAMKELLSTIKTLYTDNSLPADPRTLLHTPRSTLVVDIPGGQYWHQGLEVCLRNTFKDLDQNTTIYLNVNIDGLPIHKSSKHQLWPILCNIHQMPHIKPMAVGIFIGKSKPLSVSDYLKSFVEELIALMRSGIVVNGKTIDIKIRCFICDSPARAFLKGTFDFFFEQLVVMCVSLDRICARSGIKLRLRFVSSWNLMRTY